MLDTAIWYPEMPAVHVNLNQDCAAISIDVHDDENDKFDQHYSPIYYTNFGGDGGHLLQHLARVHGDIIGSLTFEYDGDSTKHEIPQPKIWDAGTPNDKTTLDIAGSQGERIAGVTMTFDCGSGAAQDIDPRIFGQLCSVVVSPNVHSFVYHELQQTDTDLVEN